MKTYKEEVSIVKKIHETLCNCCGAPAVQDEMDENHHTSWSCNIKIDWCICGSFPGQQHGNSSYDVCEKCFAEKIAPLLSKLPPNRKVYDQDSNTTTVTP